MTTPRADFFSILGHLAAHRHGEDQLSNTFKATFNFSRIFREFVLEELRKRCCLKGKVANIDKWECSTQITQEHRSKICRYDIYLSPAMNKSARCAAVPFLLESKIQAKLTEGQLDKYRPNKNRRHHLIAITDRYPEVPQLRLKTKKIAFLRWQDLHRTLKQAKGTTGVDRFLINSFLKYLEANDMAYGEIASSDLSKLSSMFIRIARASHNRDQKGQIRIDFLVANHCIEMLADIQRELESSFPRLMQGSWHKSAPGYWKEEDADCVRHYLGFCWWKDNGLSINFGLTFPQDTEVDDPSFFGNFWDDKRNKLGNKKECWKAISRFVHNGYVDKEKILKKAEGLLKSWAI